MAVTTCLQPGQKGTKRLTKKYGDRLVCVRYRRDPETGRKFKAIELIYEEPQRRSERELPETLPSRQDHADMLPIRIEYWETDLRARVKGVGGIWRPRQKLWEVRRGDVIELGLESRIVDTGEKKRLMYARTYMWEPRSRFLRCVNLLANVRSKLIGVGACGIAGWRSITC